MANPSKAQLRRIIDELRAQMETHAVPAKRDTKKRVKASPNSFSENLQRNKVPSGIWLNMATVEHTGTVVAGPTIKKRLERSAQNCNTTKGNYII